MQFTTVPKNKRVAIKRHKPSTAIKQYFNIPLGPALDVVDRYQIIMCADLAKVYKHSRRSPK